MTVEITRDLITERMGHVTYDRFLFYLMGPYKSFNLNYILDDEERREIDVETLPGPLRRLFKSKDDIDAAQALLRRVQGDLRVNPGVNAFLGHNFGVGEEAGSVLEALSETYGDRLFFVHEDDVTSAMIRSARIRWDLRVETYETESELISKLRMFAGAIMHQERRGQLNRLD